MALVTQLQIADIGYLIRIVDNDQRIVVVKDHDLRGDIQMQNAGNRLSRIGGLRRQAGWSAGSVARCVRGDRRQMSRRIGSWGT